MTTSKSDQSLSSAGHLVNKAWAAEARSLVSLNLASNFTSRQHLVDAVDDQAKAKTLWIQAVLTLIR